MAEARLTKWPAGSMAGRHLQERLSTALEVAGEEKADDGATWW